MLNASKAYVMQLDRAQKYELLQPVYSLNFVNDIFEKSSEMQNEYYHHYKIVNIKNTEKQIKGLEFIFIELKLGITFEDITKSTGLTQKEIRALQEKIRMQ